MTLEFQITIAGFQVGFLLFLQLVLTTAIIVIYVVFNSLQEGRANHLNDCYMTLLTSFLTKYHPKIQNLSELVELNKKDLDKSPSLNLLSTYLDIFRRSGELPSPVEITRAHRTLKFLFVALTAPVTAFLGIILFLYEAKKYRIQRIIHTELRKNHFSKEMLILFANIFFLIIALQFIFPRCAFWGFLISIPTGIGIAFSIIHMSLFIYWQQSWKDYWQYKLLDIMAFAERKNNLNLFNKAMSFNEYIESQPDIPIPGSSGFYAAVYSGIQFLLLWIFYII